MAQVYTFMTVPLTKQTVIQTIEMPQGDNGRGLNILITDDIVESDINPEQTTIRATLWGKKPSGKEVSLDATTVITYTSGDAFRCIFDGSDTFANLIAENGITECNVTLVDGESIVSTFNFNINVTKNVAGSSKVLSSEEWQSVQDALSRLGELERRYNELLPQLEDQASLTVNVRWGFDEPTVLETDKVGDLYIQTEDMDPNNVVNMLDES